jgi:ABC-type transport system substrate-binding protein
VAYLAAVPAHKATVEKNGNKYGTDVDKFVGSGPFKLTKWDHNKSFEISKNDGYWNAANVKIQSVSYLIVKQDQRISTYENDEINVVPSGNFGDLKRLQGDSKLSKEIFKFDQVGAWYLLPNPKFPPFDETKVRQAMAHAIDRDKLVKDVVQGLASAAFTPNPPSTPHYNPNKYDEATKYDPKAAMDLLKGTKYEGGKNWPKITMSMRNNEADAHKSAQAAIAQMLKENLGMNIDLEQGDPKAVYQEMWNGNKQLMWLRWYNDYPDANNVNYECFYSGITAGSRRSWWQNTQYDDLVIKAKAEPDQAKRKDLYQQADAILVKDAGAVFAYYPLGFGLIKPWLKGMPKDKQGNAVPDWNIFIRMIDNLYAVEH